MTYSSLRIAEIHMVKWSMWVKDECLDSHGRVIVPKSSLVQQTSTIYKNDASDLIKINRKELYILVWLKLVDIISEIFVAEDWSKNVLQLICLEKTL